MLSIFTKKKVSPYRKLCEIILDLEEQNEVIVDNVVVLTSKKDALLQLISDIEDVIEDIDNAIITEKETYSYNLTRVEGLEKYLLK